MTAHLLRAADLSSNNLQAFCSQTRKVGSCQSEGGRLGEQGLVLAYIFIPKPCFKFQSGFQSCNNTRGREEQEKKKKREGTLTGLRLLRKSVSRQGCLTDSQSPGIPAPGEDRAGCQHVGSEAGVCPAVCGQPGEAGGSGYKGSCVWGSQDLCGHPLFAEIGQVPQN